MVSDESESEGFVWRMRSYLHEKQVGKELEERICNQEARCRALENLKPKL